jgi:hypothetical protein
MMNHRYLKFRISQLRQDKIILILESISIFILALFVAIFLPQLLFQFVYAGQQLTAEPATLQYIPVVSFTVAILYFLYATVMVVMKKMKIMKLEKELEMLMTREESEEPVVKVSVPSSRSANSKMSMALAKKSSAKKKTTKK